MAVDGVVVAVRRRLGAGLMVRDDLVPEQIEVDPLVGTAALRAAEHRAVELPRGGEIVDREGDMKRRELTHVSVLAKSGRVAGV